MPCFRFHHELETRPVFTELFAGGTRVFWASRGLISRDLGGGKVRAQLGFASKAFNVNLFWYVSPRKGENPLFSKHHRGLLLQTWGGLGGRCVCVSQAQYPPAAPKRPGRLDSAFRNSEGQSKASNSSKLGIYFIFVVLRPLHGRSAGTFVAL